MDELAIELLNHHLYVCTGVHRMTAWLFGDALQPRQGDEGDSHGCGKISVCYKHGQCLMISCPACPSTGFKPILFGHLQCCSMKKEHRLCPLPGAGL